MKPLLPMIVLGGGDGQRDTIPLGLQREDMLSGFKGAERLPWGRCVAGELVERLKQSGRFSDLVLVGPKKVYQGNVDCDIVDASGGLDVTLRCAQELIRKRFGATRPVAVSACDILPTPGEIRDLIDGCYQPHEDCALWWQMVLAEPAELRASSWKPSYRLRLGAGQPPVNLYPGHIVIIRLDTFRTGWINRYLELAYKTRNQNLYRRVVGMTARFLATLVTDDVRHLVSLEFRCQTISIAFGVFRTYYQYSREQLTVEEFALQFGKIFLTRGKRRSRAERPVVISITRAQSFAKDIDTRAELAEAAASGPSVSET